MAVPSSGGGTIGFAVLRDIVIVAFRFSTQAAAALSLPLTFVNGNRRLPMLAGLPVTLITNSSSGSGYWFSRFAAATANGTGSTSALVTAVMVVALWSLTGPFFSYSDSWQLVIMTIVILSHGF